jgi:predicted GNAT family N-acyltransferase
MLTLMDTDFALNIKTFKTSDNALFSAARNIRENVFIVEQKVAENEEFDEFEEESNHYLLMLDDQSIGTARWRRVGDKVKLERFAVLKEYRGKAYGDHLLQAVLKDAQKEARPIYLHAQLKAIPFYERRGFKPVGDLFVECEIEHYKMVWD